MNKHEKWLEELKAYLGDPVRVEKLAKEIKQKELVKSHQSRKVLQHINNEQLLDKFLIWEKKYQRRQYEKGIETESRTFHILTEVIGALGIEFNCDKDFMYANIVYDQYNFQLFIGQGSFWKVFKNGIQML